MPEALAPDLAALGAAIRARRKEAGKTLSAVGAGLWRHPHLSKVERGLEWPSVELLAHIEVQLEVPPGTYLKQYGAIENQRWGHQETYRRSGVPTTPQPASLAVPILLQQLDGTTKQVVPAMIRDYDPADRPPYQTLFERVHYLVDQGNGETISTMTWEIQAAEDECEDFQFNLGYPGSATEVILTALEGAALTGLGRYGARHLHLELTLNSALSHGECTTLTFRSHVSGLTAVPRFKYSSSMEDAPSELAVQFVDRCPSSIWWFEHIPPEAAPGLPTATRKLVLDDRLQTHKRFTDTRPGGAYGIGWNW